MSFAKSPPGARSSRDVEVRIIPDWISPTADAAKRREAPTRAKAMDRPRSSSIARAAHVSEPVTSTPTPRADQPPSSADVAGAPLSGLRSTLGCRNADFLQLSSAERQQCRDRFATATPGLPADTELGIDPIKKAAFDASWRADHSEQHMAGIACLAKFGRGGLKWAHPSEGLKLGPLPCYAYTPKATFAVDPPPARGW